MYFSKVSLKNGPKLFNFLKQRTGTEGYTAHKLLWDLFPNNGDKKRDFLFYKDDKNIIPSFLVVSRDRPAGNEALSIQTKEYSPNIFEGQKLAFTLVANPVVSRKIDGKKNSVKHDVWMDAKKQAKANGKTGLAMVRACEKASKEWLIRQGERCGFFLKETDVIIDGYIQNRFYKGRSINPIQYSSIHYEGILAVSDVEKFIEMLYSGIGRSKAFGCGLMLVRKI